MSTFGGIETALSGLQAQQLQIETSSNNVSNANTPGYHRQVATLVDAPPASFPTLGSTGPGQVGTGVLVSGVQRTIDPLVASSLQAQLSQQGSANVAQQTTSQIQGIFNDLSTSGISTLLSNFWNSWQNLANSPSDLGVRSSVISQSQTLASTIQQNYGQLVSLQQNLDQQVGQQVTSLNSLSGQVATLNQQIAQTEAAGQQPNNLLDQRDSLVGQMASLAQINVANLANGSIQVTMNGTPLVDGGVATTLTTSQNASGWQQIVAPNGTVLQPSGGSLAGLENMRDQQIPQQLTALNAWATRLMQAVNTVESGQDPTTGTTTNVYNLANPGTPAQNPFFVGTGAADIAVNPALVQNPALIAASQTPNGPGDGSNAQAVAALQQNPLAGDAPTGSPTIDSQYQAFATAIGNSASAAQAASQDQNTLVQNLQQLDQQLGGVSLNEEAANLQTYQLAYQASSRVLTVFDTMLDQLINHTGTAGIV